MEWAYIFNTSTRQEYGLFYLDLIQAFDAAVFTNPDNVPIIAMCGSRGKSLAADVMFHHLLDRLNPMDIIDGEEVRHMYLESKPKDAIHRPFFDHGRIQASCKKESDISLMFINQPIPEIFDQSYYNKSIGDRDAIVALCLRKSFKQERKGNVGGLVFASGFGTFDQACLTISMDGGAHNDWETEHTVFVNLDTLKKSEKFHEGWKFLIAKYRSRSVLQPGP